MPASSSLGGFGGPVLSYSTIRTALAASATSAEDTQSLAALPATSALQGVSSFLISTSEEKAIGMIAGNLAAIDGSVGMGTGFTGASLIAAGLHEITHAMGRTDGSLLDFFRYSSAGVHVFGGGSLPQPASYFSLDGGVTDLADFGMNSDPSDFLNPPGSTKTPNDPFNEIVGSISTLTAIDITVMDVLGFHRAVIDDYAGSAATTGNIAFNGSLSGNIEVSGDHDWFRVNLVAGRTYTFRARGAGSAAGTLADTFLALRDSAGTQLASNNDFSGLESRIVFTAGSSGVYYVDASANAAGATGTYTVSAYRGVATSTNDYNNNRTSDLLLQSGGTYIDWTLQNGVATGTNYVGAPAGYTVAGKGDFNGDGTGDLLLRSGDGVVDWSFSNGIVSAGSLIAYLLGYSIVGTGDFNGDGTSDLLLQSGVNLIVSTVQNGVVTGGTLLGSTQGYSVVGTGDFNGDGTTDILLQSGASVVDYLVYNNAVTAGLLVGSASGYSVVGTGDFNGDGTCDLLMQNGANVFDWTLRYGVYANGTLIGATNGYSVVGTGDYNGDGVSDIALQSGGNVIDWSIQNGLYAGGIYVGNAGAYSAIA